MFRYLLQSTGIERKVLALKAGIEDQVQYLIRTGKAAFVHIAIAGGLVFGAGIVFLMAVGAAFTSAYFLLLPQIGSAASAAAVGGGLLLLSVIIGFAAAVVARQIPAFEIPSTPVREPFSCCPNEPLEAAKPGFLDYEKTVHRTAPSQDVDRMFAAAGQFVRFPKTGVEPVDRILVALAPNAQEAAKDVVERAAGAMRNGDRSTILGLLGAAVAAGWVFARTAK